MNGGNGNLDFERIVQIVSEESGVPVNDLTDDSALVELGVDEVLRLIIAGRCKEIFGLDVDTGSLFVDVQTVKDLKKSVSVLMERSAPACHKPKPRTSWYHGYILAHADSVMRVTSIHTHLKMAHQEVLILHPLVVGRVKELRLLPPI